MKTRRRITGAKICKKYFRSSIEKGGKKLGCLCVIVHESLQENLNLVRV